MACGPTSCLKTIVRRSTCTTSPGNRDLHVAGAAQQAVVLQSAFAAAVRDRDDVVRLPARAFRAPGASCRPIAGRRLAPGPLAMRLDDIQSAELTRTLVALLDLTPHVPGTAANLPFMDARLAAEG